MSHNTVSRASLAVQGNVCLRKLSRMLSMLFEIRNSDVFRTNSVIACYFTVFTQDIASVLGVFAFVMT